MAASIYPSEGAPGSTPGYVVAENGVWVPGVYESEDAALYAVRLPDATLQRLQDSVNPHGVITMAMLHGAEGEE